MSDAFIKKNTKLSLEFDRFMAEHWDVLDEIPDKAWLIVTIEGDERFNTASRSLVRDIPRQKIVEAHKSADSWIIRPLHRA